MKKIIKVAELPKGFIYFSDTHIVEGTGENFIKEEIENGGTIRGN